jgi:hypothetical protein
MKKLNGYHFPRLLILQVGSKSLFLSILDGETKDFPIGIIIIPSILGRFGQYNPRTNHQATGVLNTAHLKSQQF